jgi:hypothetical protein
MITDRIYKNQNLLSLLVVSFLVGLSTYQRPCISVDFRRLLALLKEGAGECFPRLANTRRNLTNVLFVVYLSYDGEMDGTAY